MPEIPPAPVRLQLFFGPAVPVPAPKALMDALQEVKVEAGAGDSQSGFELTFAIPKGSPVQALFPVDLPILRVVIAVALRGTTEVLVDGLVTHHDLSANGPTLTLHVKGKDLTDVMNLIPFDGLPYPAMPDVARVALILAKYVALGCVPMPIPTISIDVPIPTEQIPTQKGTDYQYLKWLANQNGYVFYLEPGPVPGASIAYWGPEIRIGIPQPALNLGLDSVHDNVSTLNFTFDKDRKEMPIVYIQDALSKAPIPIPIPDLTPLSPPLGAIPPLPPKIKKINETGNLKPVAALLRGIAYAAQHADSVFATGSLDVARYGHVLRSRRLVGVRGVGAAYDGLYYVTRVTHEIKRGSYTQSFSLARNGVYSTVNSVPA